MMPLIESIRVTGQAPEQLVARVRLDRTELVMHGDVFPHFGGKQYLSLSTMRLIDGPDGEWKKDEHGTDTRLVEAVVRPVDSEEARGWKRESSKRGKRGPKPKANGILPHEPFSGDKAAE